MANPERGWRDRLLSSALTLLVSALAVRWAISLILPVLPWLVGLLVVFLTLAVIWRRRSYW